ncbi:MAG TPA: ATP-binding protein [Acetobacteraceae bacterium]|nr:ATP-binding protein [Acetobacteraceae bacterium]
MTLPSTLDRWFAVKPARLSLAIGAVTIGFVLVCLVELWLARQDATAAAETQARNIAASVAQDVARNLELYDLALQTAAQGVQVPGVMQLGSQLRDMILFPRATRGPYFGFINVLDATGGVIADSEFATTQTHNWASRDYFIAEKKSDSDPLYIGKPFLIQVGQSPTISISRRIENPNGSFAGVVVGSMRLAYFRDLFSRLNLGPHSTIALLRRDGMILMRLPFNLDDIGRSLPADAPFFSVPNGGQVNAIDPTDHLRRRFLFQPIGTMPLMVAIGLADTDIYAAWRARALALGLSVAVLSAIDAGLFLMLRAAFKRRDQGEAALRESHAKAAALAAEREAALATMAKTAAAKSRFLAVMSHEFRTLLNSILGHAELLDTDGALSPAQASNLAVMRSADRHLRAVIDRVLDFSRLEANDRPAPSGPTNLPDLVSDCLAFIRPHANRKALELRERVAPDVPRDVLADAVGLRQVLVNLLDNAVKFTAHGDVSLLVSCGDANIRFAVADTGSGVPAAQRGKLFQPYERLDADRTHIPGTGLGLTIAKTLVARMGGRIDYQDNPGGGSIFWFEVPLPEAPAALALEPAAAAPIPTDPLRILVADDSPPNRSVAVEFLSNAGHTVAEAEDGKAAFRHAAAEDFDVILMDLGMGQHDGITAARRIRALAGPRGRTPIIAVTARADEDDGAALREAGFQARLLKPIEQNQLLAAVAAATGTSFVAPERPAEPAATPPTIAAATTATIGSATLQPHTAALADVLRRMLQALDAEPSVPTLIDLVHRVAGDAGQLRHTEVAAAARQYETALRHRNGELAEMATMAETLRRAARDVLARL